MIIQRSVRAHSYQGFSAGPAGTIPVTQADGTVVYKTGAEMAQLLMDARNAGIKPTLATNAPPQLVPITEKSLLIDTPFDTSVPSILTDSSGKLDPTRLAIFGLGAVGLVAGIFMLKTKRG